MAGPAPAFEIWQADGRVASIDSPMRLQVLRVLERGPATLGDLVRATGKAKSTLSALHLRPLLRLGLVAEQTDAADRRVKWYTLRGSRLGSSAVAASTLRDAVLGYVHGGGRLPLRPVLDILDVPALVAAASPSYAQAVAARVGAMAARLLTSTTRAGRAAELDAILRREGLGRLDRKGVAEPEAPATAPFLDALVRAALA